MAHRSTHARIPGPAPRLVRVGTGVAVGNARRGHGNAWTEAWSMFKTRQQFDACHRDDPLRFTDPLLFARIRTEFEHVFDQSDQRGS